MSENTNVSLRDLLGLKDGMSTLFVKAPPEYFSLLGRKHQPYDDIESEYDFIHAFYMDLFTLENSAEMLTAKLSRDGVLWVSWPNKSEDNVATSIDETQVRAVFRSLGLIDSQTLSIDDRWNGMKFSFAST